MLNNDQISEYIYMLEDKPYFYITMTSVKMDNLSSIELNYGMSHCDVLQKSLHWGKLRLHFRREPHNKL